jgi:serine/threonine-protein kinase
LLSGCGSTAQPAAGLAPVGPAAEGGIVSPANGAAAQAKPAKYVYKVLGNYRATQLHYTASNGDMVDLNNTGRVDTAGSALPWTGEAAPEPNGNPNVLSASTLSEKGDSYITCIITDDQGNVVVSETGRGAYASCYASTP